MKNNKVALYWVFIGVLIVLISICSFFVYYFYDLKDTDLSIEKLTINENSDITYKVKLLDNKYYDTEINTTNYITELIDNINANFNYTITFDEKVSGEYSYYILGNLSAKDKNSLEKIPERELLKTKIKKYSIDGNVINLSSSFDIEFAEYLKTFKEFKDEYNLNLNGEVSFDILINYNVYSEKIDKNITKSKVLNITIPINDITTEITKTPKENKVIYEYSDLDNNENKIYLIICIEFIGAILLFVFIIIALLKTIYNTKSEYQRKLDKILRKYDSLIVHINDLPDLSKSDVLFVNTFKDLVDASRNLLLPINYVEVVKNREVAFIITNETQAYVYKFNGKDYK